MGESSLRPLISLVIPCYNESDAFPHLERALIALADDLGREFAVEVILVDDGSTDDTWAQIQACADRDRRVRGLVLSRNFGHQAALTCGYDVARGDAVVCMDADLQDPPEVVLEMVDRWKQGYDLVHAVRIERAGETRFKLWTASVFYRLIQLLGARHVKANTGDFRLLSRRALRALGQMREHHRFIRGMVGWVGFRTTEVFYHRKQRVAGKTKYPFRKMLKFATDAVVSFSTLPLKMSFFAAICLSAIIIGYLAHTAVSHLLFGMPLVPGWSSIILAVVALGAMNLVCVGILGEYVGRIYEQVKQRPLYFIQESTSTNDRPARAVTEEADQSS
ncbi:MAG: glycosyltransferase family 2 protein [Thermoguttaceae bacterium]